MTISMTPTPPSSSPHPPAAPTCAMILVHGAWHGGWCWQRVLPRLMAQNIIPHPVTLTGLGERSHLRSQDLDRPIDLNTHVQDVVSALFHHEYDRVILVGHSYGGMVITGAASAWLKHYPSFAHRLAGLCYVDAVVPLPGECWSSGHSPATVRQRTMSAAQHQGWMPPGDASLFGLTGADRDWVNRHLTPHPMGMYLQPLDFDESALATLPRWFIDCPNPAFATIDVMRQRVRQTPGWVVRTLDTGHDPMISAPHDLAHVLGDMMRHVIS